VVLAVHCDRDSLQSLLPRRRRVHRAERDLERLAVQLPRRPEAGTGGVRVAVRHLLRVDTSQHRHPPAAGSSGRRRSARCSPSPAGRRAGSGRGREAPARPRRERPPPSRRGRPKVMPSSSSALSPLRMRLLENGLDFPANDSPRREHGVTQTKERRLRSRSHRHPLSKEHLECVKTSCVNTPSEIADVGLPSSALRSGLAARPVG